MSTSLLDAWERDKPYAVAVDTETTGVAFFDTPFLASFCWGERGQAIDLASEEGRESVRRICADTPALIFHNAKFDIQKLQLVDLFRRGTVSASSGPIPTGVHDTEALAHLLNEHRPKGLKPLARTVLGLTTDEADAISKARRKNKLTKADGLDKLYEAEPELVTTYAIKDAEFTWQLFWHLWAQLSKYDDLLSLYELERELMWVLLDMETAGMAVDLPYVEETAKDYSGQIVRAEWDIEDATGLKVFHPTKSGQKTPEGQFNPNSNDQIRAYFTEKGIQAENFDKNVLKTLDDPLAEALLAARGAKKKSDYLQAILREQRDDVLHPHFRQHGTRGRRMSSGGAEDG